MKHLLLFLLAFIPFFSFGQTDSIRGNQFELKGKLTSEESIKTACGSKAFASVYEFEIIEFSDSNYTQESIGIIFTCPEFYDDDFFELGRIYSIKVSDENQANFSWSILNSYLLGKYSAKKDYWVVEADKLE